MPIREEQPPRLLWQQGCGSGRGLHSLEIKKKKKKELCEEEKDLRMKLHLTESIQGDRERSAGEQRASGAGGGVGRFLSSLAGVYCVCVMVWCKC